MATLLGKFKSQAWAQNGALLSGTANPAYQGDSSAQGIALSDDTVDHSVSQADDAAILDLDDDDPKMGARREDYDEDDEDYDHGPRLGDDDDDLYDQETDLSAGAMREEGDESNESMGKDSRAHDFDGLEEDIPDKNWDVFEETAWENLAHADRRFWSRVNVVSRVGLCLLLFILILGASCLTNMSFLVIVYNMNAAHDDFTLPNNQTLKKAGDVVKVRWVWAAMMMTSAPYFFTLVSGVYRLCVKKTRELMLKPLLMALTVEAIHSIGLGVFVFVVAPSYDPLMVIMLGQGAALVPAALRIFRVKRQADTSPPMEDLRFNWINFAAFVLTGVFLALVGYKLYIGSIVLPIATPVSLAFLSIVWWENFVPVKEIWKKSRRQELRRQRRLKRKGKVLEEKDKEFESGSWLFRAKYAIRDRRTKIETICALWKILLNFVIPIVIFAAKGGSKCVDALYYMGEKENGCSLWGDTLDSRGSSSDWCISYLPFVVAGVGVGASGLAYKAAKVSCKIHAQRMCFAVPFLLSTPLTFVLALLTYRHQFVLGNCDKLQWPLLKEGEDLLSLMGSYTQTYWLPLIFLGMLVVGLTSSHVWTPSAERVASTDTLFVRPLYCGIMFVQSMLLNRAADDSEAAASQTTISTATSEEGWTNRMEKLTKESEKHVEESMKNSKFPRIYACATMWHETKKEMTQLLKSLFRMDSDQFTRACMWKRFNLIDKDFYLYEAHIFFDDAFVKQPDGQTYAVNRYVKDFLSVVDDAVKAIYPAIVSMEPPKKIETPYGGRLVFDMPGGNQLVVHLKNRDKIRHKKRWSQVMYMYYLLSYKLLLSKGSTSEKRRIADNTFLLALDGDVDFYPDAVQLLVDRMRRNLNVGAACGRIHPIGSGLMVWYQRFEYAVSHWLQKSTEHVFGCVLCSPGCFSLFRGSALMEDNVLKRYTKVADRARHAVQYDMGEDRWLCTLLLQQGKRVEYAAAADALTFCPDDFKEFYIQRRRWTPSTMANILNLLSDWRRVTKVNPNISILFIAYQGFLFMSSLLTPGTIFLMILGAINTAYPSLPLYGAMLLNLLPVIVFLILCFTAKTDVQIAYATILSTVYSLVMMVVLVGLLRQVAESGLCSVTAIFFLGVTSIFVLAGIIHPQEMSNLIFGLLYFLAIPSISMLLIFFAVANLNVVTWGTRDSGASSDNKKKKEATLGGALQGVRKLLSGADNSARESEVTSDYTFSFGNLFRCICCPTKKADDPVMERLGDIEDALYELRQAITGRGVGRDGPRDRTRSVLDMPTPLDSVQIGPGFSHLDMGHRETRNPLFQDDEDLDDMDPGRRHRVLDYPLQWYEEEELGCGIRDDLPLDETRFFEELIEKYLKPIPPDPAREKAMREELTRLRNKAAMLFFLGNALFVTIIFILESVAEYSPGLNFELPCDKGHAGQKIEPISITFTFIFGILLILQMIGMLWHRFSTFTHIVASTKIFAGKKRGDENVDFALNKRRNFFFDLTNSFVRPGAGGALDEDRQSYVTNPSVSDVSSGVSGDTQSLSGYGGARHFSNLIRRQTFATKPKPKNLQTVADEGIIPFVEDVARIRTRGDADNEAPDNEESDVLIPSRLNKLKGDPWRAVMSLANDRERLEMAKNRAERARQNWKFAIGRMRGTGPEQRPQTIADLVPAVLQRKNEIKSEDQVLKQEAGGEAKEKKPGAAWQSKGISMNRILALGKASSKDPAHGEGTGDTVVEEPVPGTSREGAADEAPGGATATPPSKPKTAQKRWSVAKTKAWVATGGFALNPKASEPNSQGTELQELRDVRVEKAKDTTASASASKGGSTVGHVREGMSRASGVSKSAEGSPGGEPESAAKSEESGGGKEEEEEKEEEVEDVQTYF